MRMIIAWLAILTVLILAIYGYATILYVQLSQVVQILP